MITDRLRFSVIQVNTNEILTRDLVVKEPQVTKQLSGASIVAFRIPREEQYASSAGIDWRAWAYWVVCEMEIDYELRVVTCGLTNENCKVDPATGEMAVEAIGFAQYPKDIPWLENWNDIAVDPFEIVQRIWAHLQSKPNANFSIEVVPASSGTQMLPGYGFDGSLLVFEFFALFVRAVDFPDCGDFITGLARDIPFDFFEDAWWNEDETLLNRQIRMAYPHGGLTQENLSFRLGENVSQAELADEKSIEWASDVIIRSWAPGKIFSSVLSNADMTRARRVVMEEDARIDSTERAAAWNKKKLQRRTVPDYWQKIIIDPNHSHAPFGMFDVGDSIYVEGDYPWKGEVAQWHRILTWSYDEASNQMELRLKVEGAFNYDPIDYDPGIVPAEDLNLLSNGYFDRSLSGWSAKAGSWWRYSDGYTEEGSASVSCTGSQKRLESHKISVVPAQTYRFMAAPKWEDLELVGSGIGIAIKTIHYLSGVAVGSENQLTISNPTLGDHTWVPLNKPTWTVPSGVNEITIQLVVEAIVDDGRVWFDDVRVLRLT